MTDGRKFAVARPQSAHTPRHRAPSRLPRLAALAVTGSLAAVGLTGVSPASAAPTGSDQSTAQSTAESLGRVADAATAKHDKAASSLKALRKKSATLKKEITREQKTLLTLKSEVAQMAGPQYDASTGYATPTSSTVSRDSATMLSNVVVVSEDTDGVAEDMVAAATRLATLKDRSVALTKQTATVAKREKQLGARESLLRGRADAAQQKADDAARAAYVQRVGPAVAYAMAQVGKAYVFGAAGPNAFDCSGLTMAAWSQAGVSLPHSSSAQYNSGQHIPESELQPGDLVFYYSPISHVGMYIGNGKIVNAENPGVGVVVTDLHAMPYVGAVRPGS